MKVAVVCANGRVGKLVVKEAINRGLDVTAIARGENKSAAEKYVCKDLFNLTTADLQDFDVVVDAFGAWAEEELQNHTKSLMHLCDILSGTKTRLVVVGGAGSLYVNPEHTAVVSDSPDFPPQFLPLKAKHLKNCVRETMYSGHLSALPVISRLMAREPVSTFSQVRNLL